MALTDAQATARFGMSLQDAHRTRDTALQSLDRAAVATARAAWSDMAAIVRASAHHPETIRFHFLDAIAKGVDVADAEASTRAFARSKP